MREDPHPALRANLSRWERFSSVFRDIKETIKIPNIPSDV
jgi:hypothetical protein